MDDFSHVALVLSVISALLGVLGAFLGARTVRLRISAEEALIRQVLQIYQNKHRVGDVETIVKKLDKPDHQEFANDKDFEVYVDYVQEAMQSLQEDQQRVMESAISQRSRQGRVRFFEKLAREIGEVSHA